MQDTNSRSIESQTAVQRYETLAYVGEQLSGVTEKDSLSYPVSNLHFVSNKKRFTSA
ncbi:hypothetical protein YC2023_070070 [Brassica napus]